MNQPARSLPFMPVGSIEIPVTMDHGRRMVKRWLTATDAQGRRVEVAQVANSSHFRFSFFRANGREDAHYHVDMAEIVGRLRQLHGWGAAGDPLLETPIDPKEAPGGR